ncbi:SDR family NAD(P)-dependent oxidoreductase [Mycobacterium sp. 050128]|uniref:SDR family NAD(P)-dependent oxidoreductase n=1 Tax=Mycobacterium sp. 050128 TaxID=3096112 RepID=UPI002ED7E84A
MQTRATATTSAFARRYGPWALVTGASDGIGREFVTQLAARGLNVVLVARRAAMLEALSAEIVEQQHVSCRVVPLDLSQPHSVDRLVAATSDLDIGLVVAAAGFGTSGRLIDAPLTAEVELLTVNCAAVLEMTWHYGRRLAERGRGGIVLMSSLLGFAGVPQAANYAATKAYIQSLAEGLSREFAPRGVDVISSAPGPVHSGFAARANMHIAAATKPAVVARATLNALGHRSTTRPGGLAKLLGWSLSLLPRPLQVLVLAQVMKSMAVDAEKPQPAPASLI